MSNNLSRKHHFIPQFYIKGFSNQNDDVYTYDIEFKKIANSPKKSSQIFYEEHLHTVKKFGEKSVLIEDSYMELEGMFSKFTNEMKTWSNELLQEILKKDEFSKILILMLSVQYWRNPKNIKQAKEASNNLVQLYERALPTNFELMPFEKKDIKYFQKKCNNPAEQKVIQFLLLPLITFRFDKKQLDGVKVIKLNKEDELICSDNPVMIDSLGSEFNFTGSMLYPLTNKFAITNIDFEHCSSINQFILSHANKKIIASSKVRLLKLTQAW